MWMKNKTVFWPKYPISVCNILSLANQEFSKTLLHTTKAIYFILPPSLLPFDSFLSTSPPHPSTSSSNHFFPLPPLKKKGRKDILICKGITKKGCLSTTSAHSNFLFFFISPVQQVLRGAIVAYLQINIRTDRQS